MGITVIAFLLGVIVIWFFGSLTGFFNSLIILFFEFIGIVLILFSLAFGVFGLWWKYDEMPSREQFNAQYNTTKMMLKKIESEPLMGSPAYIQDITHNIRDINWEIMRCRRNMHREDSRLWGYFFTNSKYKAGFDLIEFRDVDGVGLNLNINKGE